MVEQQTRVRESTAQDEHRLQRLRARHRGLLAAAIALLVVGGLMAVTALVVVIRDRSDTARGTTFARRIADQLSEAGLGCDDFAGSRPNTKAVLEDARCNTEFGVLRIVIYRNPQNLQTQQYFTRGYQCLIAAGAGRTQLVSVIDGSIRLALPDDNLTAAQAYRRAVGGKIVTTDCTAPPPPPPVPPTTTSAPAPPPESTAEPAPQ